MHFFSLKLAHIPEVFFDNVVKRSLLTWLASQSCPSVADLKDDIVVTFKNHQVKCQNLRSWTGFQGLA